jgi:precorrin-2 dehydrogenase / sirohydrochlorin ferrochelatase
MRYYPVGLDIKDRLCLVVGGGQVGTRKVKMLLACGARVRVVSPAVTAELEQLSGRGCITLERRAYHSHDLEEAFLVIGATDDMALNRRVHADAEQARRLCNIADQPELCNFILPAVINQGDLTITISTAGQSPAFAKYLRQHLQDQFGTEYGRFLHLMGALRKRLLAVEHAPEAHKPIFERLIHSGLLELIKSDNHDAIDALLLEILGPGYTYRELMAQE